MKIEIRNVPGAGRGVFATQDIDPGETIERCQLIIVPAEQVAILEPTILEDYVFVWGQDREQVAVVLGYGSIYNHSYTPNARYVRDFDRAEMVFVAREKIPAGTEIRTNYNGDPASTEPVWFDVRP